MTVEEQVAISSLFADNMTSEHFDFYINQTWMSYSNISSLQHIVLGDDVFIRYTLISFPSTSSIPLFSDSYNANIKLPCNFMIYIVSEVQKCPHLVTSKPLGCQVIDLQNLSFQSERKTSILWCDKYNLLRRLDESWY